VFGTGVMGLKIVKFPPASQENGAFFCKFFYKLWVIADVFYAE